MILTSKSIRILPDDRMTTADAIQSSRWQSLRGSGKTPQFMMVDEESE